MKTSISTEAVKAPAKKAAAKKAAAKKAPVKKAPAKKAPAKKSAAKGVNRPTRTRLDILYLTDLRFPGVWARALPVLVPPGVACRMQRGARSGAAPDRSGQKLRELARPFTCLFMEGSSSPCAISFAVLSGHLCTIFVLSLYYLCTIFVLSLDHLWIIFGFVHGWCTRSLLPAPTLG